MLRDLWDSLPAHNTELAETVVDGCFMIDGEALPQIPDDEPPLPTEVAAKEVDAALEGRIAWEESRADVIRNARDELEVIPATRDEGDQPVAAALLGADDAPLIIGDGPPLRKGEALHRVLELVDLKSPSNVTQTTRSVCRVAGLDEHVDEVAQMVEACLASNAVARALAASAYWREVPYTRRIEGGYATGRIDLVFQEGNELVVVDWKSDTIAPSQAPAAAEAHRSQAEAYEASLTAATGMPVREVVFVFPRAGVEGTLAFQT
jgi:ATP-dependent helicase/nuclease subunit A